MKKTILAGIIALAFSSQVMATIAAKNTIIVVAANSQLLEMPIYQEQEIFESIPFHQKNQCCIDDMHSKTPDMLLDPQNLSRILLCISKPESDEPFPFDVN